MNESHTQLLHAQSRKKVSAVCMRHKQTHKHTFVIRKFNDEQIIKFLDIGQLYIHTYIHRENLSSANNKLQFKL